MLSRTADNLYWLARYVERAEYLARILEATQRLTTLAARLCRRDQRMGIGGRDRRLRPRLLRRLCRRRTRRPSSTSSRFSPANPSSIRNCFEVARTNARAVRTALTVEMWDAINGTWLELKRFGNGPTSREEFTRFLRWVQESSLRFDGSAYRTMLRNDAYWFSRLGVYLERADNTARILDVKYHLLLPANEQVGGPLDYFQWAAILRSVSALTAYHWVYRESVKPWLIADLLILQGRDAALARELLREPGALPRRDRPRLRPPGAGAAAGPRDPHAAARTAAWRRFSRAACTNSSTSSSSTTTGSAPPSPSSI